MSSATSVLAAGIVAVAQRPGLVVTTYLATLLVATPVAAALSSAAGPALTGFAAPLDNLSAVFDLSERPAQALAGAAAYGLVWVSLWGGVLEVFARGANGRGFIGGAKAFLVPMLRLSLVALCAYAFVFLVLHPIVFGWLFGRLAAGVDSERVAFGIRVALYMLFGILLTVISLAIDYARVQTVVCGRRRTFEALGAALDFVRKHAAGVCALAVLAGVALAGLLACYWGFDRVTRGAPSLISVVAVGQAYILGRLALRLVYAAAEVRLVMASVTADTRSGAVARSE